MQFTAQQIASLLQGTIEGDPEKKVHQISRIEEAEEGSLSFIANPKYQEHLYKTKASIIIVNKDLALQQEVKATLIRVPDAYNGFAFLMEQFNELFDRKPKSGIEQPASVSDTAQLGEDVYVGAFSCIGENTKIGKGVKIAPGCYIGDNVVIGDDSSIYPGVRIYDGCILGKRIVVHSGVVIGSDGFGFAPNKEGVYKKIPQLGNVVIEDDVEIGANTTIDRATMGSTYIRKGVKLDNLIMVGHNVEIGEHTVIAAQSGISGSTKIGKHAIIGGQVGIVGHIQLADGTRINAQSGITKTISEKGLTVNGSPAFDYKTSLKSQAIFRNLPDVTKRLSDLEATVKTLKALLESSKSNEK